ncbi:hydrogenase maturation nickel metallochaperone HypA [Micromonospora eburnea]|uniref:Hydrogenase nickel incorporation protein HypA/HybF n=1 Tax=Micromonospora eburnea TaxID=227316 RepID=A0A1C6UG47_9ACTN|nr:hydrogenase maturation nickel metallochaperone HypA [Micromonospora eburnea]SCL52952.1 hydrogenase nickel incorporation protein HypA/HybF [Micromonospora eburnea]
MHETGLSEAIVAAAVRRAAGRRVTALRVRIGGHLVDPDVVTQNIQVAAVDTVVADAAVDLVLEPMTVRCHGCGRSGPITDHLAMVACPQCGGVDIDITGSDDVVLESVTVASVELGAV